MVADKRILQPFALPRAMESGSRKLIIHEDDNGFILFTFPYTSPEDVTIVNVHHNPLAIERIFVNRTKN